jgi:N-acetylglucosamine-6-phosphate deacetylase
MKTQVFTGARVFDGTALHDGLAVVVADGRVAGLTPAPPPGQTIALPGGILAPGMIDLQVNGGGGVMVDGTATAASLAALCATHARLGATGILPTLITDTPAATAAVLAAGVAATRAGAPGFLGLHLEGPHLDPARKGAHDAAVIRPMDADDLARLCDAAQHLPALMVTLAPAAVSPDQIAALTRAGVIVSLGHTDCTYAQAQAAQRAGARVVTHLFNAMSPLGHREPGLVGAALALPLDVGLIADGVHVHPQAIRLALAAKQAGQVFLVSDAMAVAGTDLSGFTLGGRRILRADGRLTLADGTLAGADLTLPRAVAVMIRDVGLPVDRALAMATRVPAQVIGRAGDLGQLLPGRVADMVHLAPDGSLRGVWRAGRLLDRAL